MSRERLESVPTCVLCCHEIDNVSRFDTVGTCGHTGCCSICALRMRQLLGSASCVICKTELPRVICVEHADERFDSFQDWGDDNIGPTHVFDEASGMFFLKRDAPSLHKLRDPVCPRCGKNFASLAALKTHLMDVHQLQFCAICLEHKKAFLAEHELFSKEQLKRHNTKGTPAQGFSGHPRCDFCFSRHYSTAELYDHLHKTHFECDICLHALQIQNRYYKNYPDLENHFRADHFLCEEPVCLMKKFVVFRSHLDLHAHLAKEHPHIKASRKLDVHFTIRRATHDDSTGFEDYDSARFQSASASGGSDRNIINVADFPSLAGSGASSTGSVFWESQAVTGPRSDDFPALGGGSARGGGGGTASTFRNVLAPPPTPAMLAHMHGGDQWEYPELASAAAALGANNPLMRFVKPSKMKNKRGKKGGGGGGGGARPADASELEEKAAAPSEDDDEEEEEGAAGPEHSKSAIVLKLRQVLGSDAKYEVFREECKAFRLAEADVPTFYAKMQAQFSPQDFETLFLRLMRLFPDKAQVDKFFAHHKQVSKRQNAAQGFQDSHGKKHHKQQKNGASAQKLPVGAAPVTPHRRQQAALQQPTQPSSAGWANALRETGAAARPVGRGPAVVIHNTDTRQLLGRDEPPKTSWRSSQTWQAVPTPAAPVSNGGSGLTPVSTKIQTAPVDAFQSLSVSTSSVPSSSSSYAGASLNQGGRGAHQPPTLKSREEFPGLPSAGRPIGVQAATRATWDDQVQAIAQNRSAGSEHKAAASGGGGKKKQKKKSMTLGEMAMKFS
ncbi:hypothetical protein PybrP1_007883 [[Pythium] brassicae (nom. inval.)]|nr:hypothetical protein PybrP1_007883 [[Pythium] brassicae (nom. inval.)]